MKINPAAFCFPGGTGFQPVNPHRPEICAPKGLTAGLANNDPFVLRQPKALAWSSPRNTCGDCRTSSKSKDAAPCDNCPHRRHTRPVSSNGDANQFWGNKSPKAGEQSGLL